MTRTEPVEELLQRALKAHDRDLTTITLPDFAPSAPEGRRGRRSSVLAGVLVAAAVAVVGVSASVLNTGRTTPQVGVPLSSSSPAPSSSGGARTARASSGEALRTLSYAGLTLRVPQRWAADSKYVHCGGKPDRDFVIIAEQPFTGARACLSNPNPPPQGIWIIDGAVAQSWSWLLGAAPTTPVVVGDGIAALRGTDDSGSTVVQIPSHDVYLKIMADQRTVDEVLASITLAAPRPTGVTPTTIAQSSLAADDTSCTAEPTVHPTTDYVAPPASLAEMADASVAVVRVRATADRRVITIANRGADPAGSRLPYTTTVVELEKVIVGENPGATFTLTQPGGPGNCWAPNTKLLQPGREYVIAVVPHRSPGATADDGLMALNGTQGLFELSDGTVTRVDPVVTTIPKSMPFAAFAAALQEPLAGPSTSAGPNGPAGARTVAQWVESFGDDTTRLTRATLALPRGESNGEPTRGPAASLTESGGRASRVVYGRIIAVGARPTGLVSLTVQSIEHPEAPAATIPLRAVINGGAGRFTLLATAGQYLPSELETVVIVTDRSGSDDFPQPGTGVYVVGSDGRVTAQEGSPLAHDVDGMRVDELLRALGGER